MALFRKMRVVGQGVCETISRQLHIVLVPQLLECIIDTMERFFAPLATLQRKGAFANKQTSTMKTVRITRLIARGAVMIVSMGGL
jgi:hypothetical protein